MASIVNVSCNNTHTQQLLTCIRIQLHKNQANHNTCVCVSVYVVIDQCLEDNGGCDQLCISAIGNGTKECNCKIGYTLASNQKNCDGKKTLTNTWKDDIDFTQPLLTVVICCMQMWMSVCPCILNVLMAVWIYQALSGVCVILVLILGWMANNAIVSLATDGQFDIFARLDT